MVFKFRRNYPEIASKDKKSRGGGEDSVPICLYSLSQFEWFFVEDVLICHVP